MHDFPEPLEQKSEARRYTRAFTNAVQPVVIDMSEGDEHVLRACSLLLIPPPPPGVKYRVKSVPMSLTEMAAPDWGKMVQDLASHMEALPLGFSVTEEQMASLLAKLEWATGHPSCRTCKHPQRRCLCASRGSDLAPHSSWSNVVAPSTTYQQGYPPLTRGTTTVSLSQSRTPAHMALGPSPRSGTTIEETTSHGSPRTDPPIHPYLDLSITPRPPCPGPPSDNLVRDRPSHSPRSLQPWRLLLIWHQIYSPPLLTWVICKAAGRGRGVLRAMTPSLVTTPGASQSQGGATVGQGRGICPQHGETEPSSLWPPSRKEVRSKEAPPEVAPKVSLLKELLCPDGSVGNLLINPTLRPGAIIMQE